MSARLALGAVGALAGLAALGSRQGSRGVRAWTAEDAAWAGYEHEGANDPDDVSTDDLDWRYEPAYPVASLISRMPGGTVAAWEKWLDGEDSYRTQDGIGEPDPSPPGWTWREAFTSWWLPDPTVEPVVVVEEVSGRAEGIWDGWHRTAVAVTAGLRTIPAFVGRRR